MRIGCKSGIESESVVKMPTSGRGPIFDKVKCFREFSITCWIWFAEVFVHFETRNTEFLQTLFCSKNKTPRKNPRFLGAENLEKTFLTHSLRPSISFELKFLS